MEKRIDIVQRFLKSRAVRFIAMLIAFNHISSVLFLQGFPAVWLVVPEFYTSRVTGIPD